MNIAIVDRFPHKNWYTLYLVKYIKQLISRDDRLFVYGPAKLKEQLNVEEEIIPVWSGLLWPFQLLNKLLHDRIDLVHIQYEFILFSPILSNILIFPLLVILKIMKLSIIITLHGPISPKNTDASLLKDYFPIENNYILKLLQIYIIFTYKFFSVVSYRLILHSQIFKQYLESYGIKNTIVIHHGVGKIIYKNNKINNNIPYLKYNTILFFGNLTPRKGIINLIKAFSIVSKKNDIFLVIAGRESPRYTGYLDTLKKKITYYGLQKYVIFTGYLSDDYVDIFIKNASIVVLPYPHTFSASGPLSYYVAYRKCIVASDMPYFRDILSHNYDSYLINPKDTEKFATTIESLLYDQKRRKQFISNLSIKASTFSWSNISKRTIKLYNRCKASR